MDIDALATFVDVMRRGSFTAVAKDQNIDPSSISRVVSSLEEELGARLFFRSTRRIVPTEAGNVFFEKVKPIVEQMERAKHAVQEIGKTPAGELRVATSVAFGMMCVLPLLPEFKQAHPDISVDLMLIDRTPDLVAERIDLAVQFAEREKISYPATKLFSTSHSVCAGPQYLEQAGHPLLPVDLSTRQCLLLDTARDGERWTFRRDDEEAQVLVNGNLRFSSELAVRQCALANMGPALLPDWMIGADLDDGTLVRVLPDYAVTTGPSDTAAWIIYPSTVYQPAKAVIFSKFMQSRLDFATETGADRNGQARAS
ncbi:LysR family transcriptional regulator [Bradyrhizobium prioriisuperbiae]|uniref:LysR family transcriptional regulator n=1 Tax=Bradyrhizobium prioriisuperbiae TaxID=2854389 RepID=UPI0028EA8DD6|nr:LysR family transcriptional regulator [Bradyrhizobium prioritasuperba]